VVEDHLQLRGGALAHFARQGAGLVGDQFHGADHAAPLVVPLGIGRADRLQQLAQVEPAALAAAVLELLLQEWVEAHPRATAPVAPVLGLGQSGY
jgi:hypothetical protein